jgi:xanthine dehydrogenase YagS FAD-binding subunit
MVTMAELARHEALREGYPGFAAASGALATPQIRAVGTLGGNLLQRTRCAYYRHPDVACLKNGGTTCFLREGVQEHGVCFDLGPCAFPHPSSLAMSLLTYDAEVQTDTGRRFPLAELYGDGSDPRRDHALPDGEVLTAVHLPPATPGEHAAYFRTITRARAEWPLVEAGVRLVLDGGRVTLARVAVGGVAVIPLRLPHVEEALVGRVPDTAVLEAASRLASRGATPLPHTTYKVTLLERTVLDTLERALNR